MKITLPPDVKVIALPLGVLLVLIGLSFVFVKFGLARFMLQQKQIADTQKEILVLEQKNEVLSQIPADISLSANSFAFALSGFNPVSMVISQIRTLSVSNGLLVSSISSRSVPGKDTLSKVTINISAKGTLTSVLGFLNNLDTVSPLIFINSTNLNDDGGGVFSAEISLSSYWSPFPEFIPATTEPTTELTAGEKEMISQIMGLTIPSFTELSPQSPSDQRSSPF